MITFSLFASKVILRPVATSAFTKNPLFKWFFDSIGAISVEESSTHDAQKLAKKLTSSLDQLQHALSKGDSLLLYPSGQLAGQGSEYL